MPAAARHVESQQLERELVIERVFDAPRALVFAAFTDPRHLPQWWGPKGYWCDTLFIDVREGGVWRFTMHGPDNTLFPNRIRFDRIHFPSKLELMVDSDKDDDKERDPAAFQSLITFDELDATRTKVTMRSVLQSVEHREIVVKFGAIELGRSTLDKGAAHIAATHDNGPIAFSIPDGEASLTMARVFDAPRALVWQVLTNAEHMRHWWGPRGSTLTECTLDFRVGGRWRAVCAQDGRSDGFGGVYKEIVPEKKIVQTFVWDGMPDAENDEALELFDAGGGKTLVIARSSYSALAHRDMHVKNGMESGAAETWERLAERLATLHTSGVTG